MDRAEAIKLLDSIETDLVGACIVTSSGNAAKYLDRKIAVVDVAIAALREQEQREQGCGWCDHFELDPQYLIGEGNGMYKELIFQFCPMCGRKLKEGAEG